MKFYKLCIFFIIIVQIIGCNTYVIQDIIGNPTKHLDNNKKKFVISLDYKPEYVYNKLKAYFYKNQADIYKTKKRI